MLDYARALDDLSSPPGNRLEALKGSLKGYYSIRINEQWRIVFKWTSEGPSEVDIRDYQDSRARDGPFENDTRADLTR